MRKSYTRFWILLAFVIFSVAAFFVARIFAAKIFENNLVSTGFFDQILGKIDFTVKFLGLFIVFLFISCFFGFFYGRKVYKKEISKGFVYSGFYCLFLLVIYLSMVVYVYW